MVIYTPHIVSYSNYSPITQTLQHMSWTKKSHERKYVLHVQLQWVDKSSDSFFMNKNQVDSYHVQPQSNFCVTVPDHQFSKFLAVPSFPPPPHRCNKPGRFREPVSLKKNKASHGNTYTYVHSLTSKLHYCDIWKSSYWRSTFLLGSCVFQRVSCSLGRFILLKSNIRKTKGTMQSVFSVWG